LPLHVIEFGRAGLTQIKATFATSPLCFRMDVEHKYPTPLCPSCGRLMRHNRTIPGLGALPELYTFECRSCGVVLTEAAQPGERRDF
jgi:hypothetical protein